MSENRVSLEEAEMACGRIAHSIAKQMPKGWHFTLVMASTEGEQYMTYASNLEREGSVNMLRELADSIQGRKEV